jgi:putrescine transport system substrate-binding protein
MNPKKLGLAVVMAASVSTTVMAEEQVVNFYNWSDYISPEILENFTRDTGIKVNYDVYDSNEVLEAKLMSGGAGYDVVVPTGSFLERQVQAGIYTELDRSKLTNYGNLDAAILEKIARHDPGNKHNVPYAWGTIGIGYNVDMIKERLGDMPVDTLDLVFKPEIAAKLNDCGISLLDSPAEIVAIALNYLGLDPNSEDKADLKKAGDLLKSARDNYRKFSSSAYISDLANGDICVALGYNGDVLQAQGRAEEAGQGVKVDYVIPKEGTLAWFDLMAIPVDAPHKDAAYKLVDYILRGDSGAAVSNYAYFAVANKAAEPMVLEEVLNNPGIYPTDEVKANLFPQNAHSAKFDRLLTRTWTQIKTGR